MPCKCPTHTFFWFTVFKMGFGLICFGLFANDFHDDAVGTSPLYHRNKPNTINENFVSKFCGFHSDINICNIRRQITVVACVAFPFVIEPALIVAYVIDRPQNPEITLAWLLSGVGFLTYIIGGGSILHAAIYYVQESATKASTTIAGVIFILTAVAYLYHLALMLYKRSKSRRTNPNVSTRVPPVPNAPPRELLYSEVLTPIIVTRT